MARTLELVVVACLACACQGRRLIVNATVRRTSRSSSLAESSVLAKARSSSGHTSSRGSRSLLRPAPAVRLLMRPAVACDLRGACGLATRGARRGPATARASRGEAVGGRPQSAWHAKSPGLLTRWRSAGSFGFVGVPLGPRRRSSSAPGAPRQRPRARFFGGSRGGRQQETGVMITNLGTPEEPTEEAVRSFLAEFLHDYRVVDLPRWIWCPILHGIILRVRPGPVSRKYKSIWTSQGSPLLATSQNQRDKLAKELERRLGRPVKVALGMQYSEPSIAGALQELEESGVEKVVVLPLYPQYSSSTTGSSWDYTAKALRTTRKVPDVKFVQHYHDHPGYIDSLANSIRDYWRENGKPSKLLFSFHSLPVRFITDGDFYDEDCRETAKAVAQALGLSEDEWFLSFQSEIGLEEWLSPKTEGTIEQWARQGVERVDVICPGFSADCLETLEEIDMDNRERFLQHGGKEFHYIPALNDRDDHIGALASIVEENMF